MARSWKPTDPESATTNAARLLGKRRFAKLTKTALRKHQQAAARARWGPAKRRVDNKPAME